MAIALGRAGADVCVVSRSQDQLDKVAEEIRELGVRSIGISADLTDSEQ